MSRSATRITPRREPNAGTRWPGHEQASTADIYIHADMSHKERAIARIQPPGTKPGRYHPADSLLAFLEAL